MGDGWLGRRGGERRGILVVEFGGGGGVVARRRLDVKVGGVVVEIVDVATGFFGAFFSAVGEM